MSLDVNKDDLACLLDAIILIYKQATCNIIKPQLMESTLKDTFEINDEKVQIFLNAWITYGKGIIDHFRQISIFPVQVCSNMVIRNNNIYFILICSVLG